MQPKYKYIMQGRSGGLKNIIIKMYVCAQKNVYMYMNAYILLFLVKMNAYICARTYTLFWVLGTMFMGQRAVSIIFLIYI